MISMKKLLTTTLAALTLGAVALLGIAASAEAKPMDDHLACFKIKDSAKLRVKLNLLANEAQIRYSIRGCKMKARADEFCVPATKIVTYGEHNPIGGQRLENDFLCYHLRCERQRYQDRQWVKDQFGRRQIGAFRPTKICTPAWKLNIDGTDIEPVDPQPVD
jgi:hypothetical protein